jgi:PleD family two-component response regulator
LAKNTILTIGDCYALNYLINTVLSKDFIVQSVKSNAEAIKYLQTNLASRAIILDISDVNSECFELLEHLNTSAILRNIKTIIISSSHDEFLKTKTMELGAMLFLTKPFDPIYLSDTIKQLIDFGRKEPFIKMKKEVLLKQ